MNGKGVLLTFLSKVGTFGGIGFTIFGYFQSTKIPAIVDREVKKVYDQIEKRKKKSKYVVSTDKREQAKNKECSFFLKQALHI